MVLKERLIKVSSNEAFPCPLCERGVQLDGGDLRETAAHLFQHGLKCVHVGQETTQDDDGKPWHSTVAVFGK